MGAGWRKLLLVLGMVSIILLETRFEMGAGIAEVIVDIVNGINNTF